MSEAATIAVAVISSGALTAFVQGIIAWKRSKKMAQTGVSAGVRILLYDRIKHLGKDYISRGEITTEELEDLIEMHRIYHDDLGGNGFLDRLMKEVQKLKIIGG